MRIRLAGIAGAALLLLLAAPSHASEFRIDLRKPWVRPGGTIRARMAWVIPGVGVSGRFAVRWYLTNFEGRTVASGRKVVRLHGKQPYRFRIRARTPKKLKLDVLRLHVALVDEEWDGDGISIDVSASVPVFVYRRGLRPDKERETVTGTIVGGAMTPLLVPEGSSVEIYSHELYGSAVCEILANPAHVGARVTVTGRSASIPGIGHYPMGPFPFIVEEVSFQDSLPEFLPWAKAATGHIPARIAPALLIGDLTWRKFLLESRTPRVLRTREEFDALNAEMSEGKGGPLDRIAHADFAEEMVVVVFAGISPTRDYRVHITAARYDEATETTWIEYAVTGPRKKKTGPAEWVEPYCAQPLPVRPGRVEFVRTELIPDRPAWW